MPLRTNIISEPSSAINNITLDTIGNVTSGGTAVMSSPYTMRNKIINGAMVIDQRNAGASVTPTYDTFYNIDRWSAHLSQSSKFSVQQVSDGPSGFQKSLKVTSLSAYSVLAADYFTIEQVVEGFNGADLAWGTASALTVTLSFWVKSSLTGTFGGAFVNYSAGSYANTFSYTINAANTWEYKTVTVTGATGSSWNSTNSGFLSLCFTIGSGSNYQTAAGSWGSVTGRTVPSAVNVVSTNGATWQVTGVQLERGTVATPFEYRNYQQELAMCQRYFQKSYGIGTAVGSATSEGRTYFILGTDTTARNKGGAAYFRVSMRANPTVTMYNESGATGNFTNPAAAANFVGTSTELFNAYAVSTTVSEVTGSWTASAEL